MRALDEAGAAFRILEDAEASVIRQQVEEKYGLRNTYMLCDCFQADPSRPVSYRSNSEGWRRIDEFLNGEDYIIFFDREEERSLESKMIEVSGGTSFAAIYEECYRLDFYVTDRETSYVLCETDHDILMGVGRATEWKVFTLRYSDEIVDRLQALGSGFRVLTDAEGREISRQVEEKYARHGTYYLWMSLEGASSRSDPEGWRRIDEFLDGRDYLVFLDRENNPRLEPQTIEVEGGTRFAGIYNPSHRLVYYVTDRETSYLICFNNFETLFGAGSAKEWEVFTAEDPA